MFTEARAEGFLPGTRLAPLNFVISHETRERLNARCNEADMAGRDGVVRFTLEEYKITKETKGQNYPQDASFWPGMKVIACRTMTRRRGAGMQNGVEYRIKEIGDKVSLEPWAQLVPQDDAADDSDSDDGGAPTEPEETGAFTLSRLDFFRHTRLPYCVTLASIQGITVDGLVAVHDTKHTHFTPRMLFVALSRARAHNQIIVY